MATSRSISGGTGDPRPKRLDSGQGKEKDIPSSTLSSRLQQLKKQIQATRLANIKERVERNRKVLRRQTDRIFDAVEAAARVASVDNASSLLARMANNIYLLSGTDLLNSSGDREFGHVQEENFTAGTLAFVSGGGAGRTILRFVELPAVDKIPPYTTWMFLDKNQRMAEDQSVVGRKRIYYDPVAKEALICSDSDEEIPEPEEEKHVFTEGEEQMLRSFILEYGLNREVTTIISQVVDASPSDIEDRYKALFERTEKRISNSSASSKAGSDCQLILEKNLDDYLDSFDNLFCRRCLIFDCRLHGCNQNVVFPWERQPYAYEHDENKRPCGDKCYLRTRESYKDLQHYAAGSSNRCDMKLKSATESRMPIPPSESEDSNPDEEKQTSSVRVPIDESTPTTTSSDDAYKSKISDTEAAFPHDIPLNKLGNRKDLRNIGVSQNVGDSEWGFQGTAKKQKILALSELTPANDDMARKLKGFGVTLSSRDDLLKEVLDESSENTSKKDDDNINRGYAVADSQRNATINFEVKGNQSSSKGQAGFCWSKLERELYLKGIEIFGRNSCLIARNLLSGLKTCSEVASFMYNNGLALQNRPHSTDSDLCDFGIADQEYMYQEMSMRARNYRRRGKTRKLKYTWKAAGLPTSWKRIGDGKHQCRQYTPCGCQQMCSKECPCMENSTCCEKYCGCSKSCKNRFRGCHCAKSQCRSRQCPCFAAGRECDPDVCRNCWVSCGDGTLGEPPVRGDGYQCGNMKLLLKQRQRILLAKSDVAGWGAFIKNPVYKNDYLGEYTGELISHKEADKRGKIYDRANSSFLFDLNDQYVLDAYRRGDKLKFANHSSNPNCYAKVMFVAGDHRVGIYAKEHIEASEELFYDYRYGPDQAPAWARKPEGSKRDEASVSHNRAHKVA